MTVTGGYLCAIKHIIKSDGILLFVITIPSVGRKIIQTPHDPQQNQILAALQAEECKHLFSHLELIPLPLGHVLCEPGTHIHHAYFPTTSIVSQLYVTEDGASAEIAVVGNEGIVGISLFMGGETTPSRAVVQSAGHAYRLQGQLLKQEFARSGGRRSGILQHLLLRYTQALLTQMAQTAVCNRLHKLEQQLCRCLLMRLDRLTSIDLVMTQEQIASLLGVRRESITEAAGNLQKAGLIDYKRGHITILDRARLERRVCECYAVVKKENDRLLQETLVPKSVANRMYPGSIDRPPRRNLYLAANARC